MSKQRPANLPASIHQRLLNLSIQKHEDFNRVLTEYATERLLYRLGRSAYASDFILKGARLLAVWTKRTHRPTRDLDLLGFGEVSQERMVSVFQEICRAEVEPDGLHFDADSVRAEEVGPDRTYPGIQVSLEPRLGNARVPLRIDVGFGDALISGPDEIDYPTLLPDLPAPRLRAYPRDAVVAEKLHALVVRGVASSRMNDIYDLWVMARRFSFNGLALVASIKATFERRQTPIPPQTPTALSREFPADAGKIRQWDAFRKRTGLEETADDLPQVIDELHGFFAPPLSATASAQPFDRLWHPGGPWSPRV